VEAVETRLLRRMRRLVLGTSIGYGQNAFKRRRRQVRALLQNGMTGISLQARPLRRTFGNVDSTGKVVSPGKIPTAKLWL